MKIIKIAFFAIICSSCGKDVKNFTYTHFDMQFSETQERLNNTGSPAVLIPGHAAQTPVTNNMSIHYIELSADSLTPYKSGAIVYKAPETFAGGQLSIDFDSCVIASADEDFYRININKIPPGTYNYIRTSVAYQNYTIQFNLHNIPVAGDLFAQTGTIASFIGYRTYIGKLTVQNMSTDIYADKDQGFWAFETSLTSPDEIYNGIYTGQSPAGSTTVVNPLAVTSPIPAGSCVVTGKFAEPLVITGEEADDELEEDLFIHLSFSVNQSFEWLDSNGNGEWDIDAVNPDLTEHVTDMGVRGLIPSWEWKNQ